jgi:Zn-dependent metalloprotease
MFRGDGATNKQRATVGVDAHFGASATLQYYSDVHGRSGIDGRGSVVRSRVHLSKGYDNAYCE